MWITIRDTYGDRFTVGVQAFLRYAVGLFSTRTRRWKRRAIVRGPAGTGDLRRRSNLATIVPVTKPDLRARRNAASPLSPGMLHVPSGTIENSPPVHWRDHVRQEDHRAPEGHLIHAPIHIRPSGINASACMSPIQASLRDAVTVFSRRAQLDSL